MIIRSLVVAEYDMERGGALENRVLCFVKGQLFNGIDSELLLINSSDYAKSVDKGVYDGIKVSLVGNMCLFRNNKIKKLLIVMCNIFKLQKNIKRTLVEKKYNVILMFHLKLYYQLILLYYAKKYNVSIIHERNEIPTLGLNSVFKKLEFLIYSKFMLKKYSGFIFITNYLSEYLVSNYKINNKFVVIPIMVDADRFLVNPPILKEKYLAYSGCLNGNKDGVPLLIKSFANIHKQFPEYKLYLIGDISNKTEYHKLKKIIRENSLNDKIVFTGMKDRYEIVKYLLNASVLLLARPDSLQARGGFPTKLGEYLATGKPVVVTSVGEIPRYITDRINGYLAMPDSVESFSKKLTEVLNDYEMATAVGQNGKKLALDLFSYQYQGKRIKEFILELIND